MNLANLDPISKVKLIFHTVRMLCEIKSSSMKYRKIPEIDDILEFMFKACRYYLNMRSIFQKLISI